MTSETSSSTTTPASSPALSTQLEVAESPAETAQKVEDVAQVALALTPTQSLATIRAKKDAFVLVRLLSNGTRVLVDLHDKQEELDGLWKILKTGIMDQAKKESPALFRGIDENLVDISIDWRTGHATLTFPSGVKKEMLFSEKKGDAQSLQANVAYQKMWNIFEKLGAVEKEISLAVHTDGLTGAALGHSSDPFTNPHVQKNKPHHASKSYAATIIRGPSLWQRITRNRPHLPQEKEEAREKREELLILQKFLAILKKTTDAKIAEAEGQVKGNQPAADREKAIKRLESLQVYRKHLEDLDEFALGWALEHPFKDNEADLSVTQRVAKAKNYVDRQVQLLAKHLGYDWETYGKHWYCSGNAQTRDGMELYFKNIALLSIRDPLIHTLVCKELGIEEPESSLGRAILLSMQKRRQEAMPQPAPSPVASSLASQPPNEMMRSYFENYLEMDPDDQRAIEAVFAGCQTAPQPRPAPSEDGVVRPASTSRSAQSSPYVEEEDDGLVDGESVGEEAAV